MNKQLLILTLSMLASAPYKLQARYLNHARIIEVTAKLKALERNPEKVELFEKSFHDNFLNRFMLLPGTYNRVSALMLELLDTADQKPVNQQTAMLQVLEMIDSELMGLINRYGYRRELISMSYRTMQLRATLAKGAPLNPIFAAELKREIQDLIAEALTSEKSSEALKLCIKKHMRKKQGPDTNESHNESEYYDQTDSK